MSQEFLNTWRSAGLPARHLDNQNNPNFRNFIHLTNCYTFDTTECALMTCNVFSYIFINEQEYYTSPLAPEQGREVITLIEAVPSPSRGVGCVRLVDS